MQPKKKYVSLGIAFNAYLNCSNDNHIWHEKWTDAINQIIDSLPHGSGIDGKTEFNFNESRPDKLVIDSQYHCMNENGFYDGMYDFKLILKPDWQNFKMQIKSNLPKKYKDSTIEYLSDLFYHDLTQDITLNI
jgi:hypothetical protein